MSLDVAHYSCVNPWPMKARKQKRRGRPPSTRKIPTIWEFEEDPVAEEFLLQALEMLLPPRTRRGQEESGPSDTREQLQLF